MKWNYSLSRTRTGRASAGFAFVVILALVVSACGSSNSAAKSPQQPLQTSIQFGTLKSSVFAPLYAADELGFFKKQGLTNVQLVPASTGATLLQLLVQGQLQFSIATPDQAINAQSQRLGVSILKSPSETAELTAPDQTAILVKKDSPIQSIKDLVGKKVGVNAIKGENWIFDGAMFKKAGVNPTSITSVVVPFPNMLDALTNGSADAVVDSQPFVQVALATGNVRVLTYPFLDVKPGIVLTEYVTSSSWAKSHASTVKAVQKALQEGVAYLQQNRARALAFIAQYTGAPTAVVNAAGLPRFRTADLQPADLQYEMNLMVSEGVISSPVNLNQIFWSPPSS